MIGLPWRPGIAIARAEWGRSNGDACRIRLSLLPFLEFKDEGTSTVRKIMVKHGIWGYPLFRQPQMCIANIGTSNYEANLLHTMF